MEENTGQEQELDSGQRPAVGVLLVHGIGQQRRGESLLSFAEPLYRWVRGWLRGAAGVQEGSTYEVTIGETSLLRPSGEEGSPPHVWIDSSFRGNAGPNSGRWLLAESWWAENFSAPAFRSVAVWAMGIGPWLVQRHFDRRSRQAAAAGPAIATLADPKEGDVIGTRVVKAAVTALYGVHLRAMGAILRVGSPAIGSLIGAVLGLLTQIFFVALLVLGIFPPLRSLITRMQLSIAHGIGDSYVLLTSPVRYYSMVSQVRADIRWLAERCDAVVVVAHSQGAAIAHGAIQAGDCPKVRVLVTVGSALRKLHVLREALATRRGLAIAYVLRVAAIGMLVAAGVILAKASAWVGASFTVIALSGGAVATLVLSVSLPFRGLRPLTSSDIALPGLGDPDRLRWIDLIARSDPVPEEPLPEVQGLTSAIVVNRGSVLRDHSSYWENAEAVALVAQTIAEAGGWESFHEILPGDSERLGEAYETRESRLFTLQFGRLALLACFLVVTIPLGWSAIKDLGYLVAAPIQGVVGIVSDSVAEALRSAFKWALVETLCGLLVIALVITSAYRLLVFPAWLLWGRHVTDRLFARTALYSRKGTITFRFSIGFIILAAAVGPQAWLAMTGRPNENGLIFSAVFSFVGILMTTPIGWSPLSLKDVQPRKGQAGSQVQLSGKGFPRATEVSFNGVPAELLGSDETTMLVRVPRMAASGPIIVRTRTECVVWTGPFLVEPGEAPPGRWDFLWTRVSDDVKRPDS